MWAKQVICSNQSTDRLFSKNTLHNSIWFFHCNSKAIYTNNFLSRIQTPVFSPTDLSTRLVNNHTKLQNPTTKLKPLLHAHSVPQASLPVKRLFSRSKHRPNVTVTTNTASRDAAGTGKHRHIAVPYKSQRRRRHRQASLQCHRHHSKHCSNSFSLRRRQRQAHGREPCPRNSSTASRIKTCYNRFTIERELWQWTKWPLQLAITTFHGLNWYAKHFFHPIIFKE